MELVNYLSSSLVRFLNLENPGSIYLPDLVDGMKSRYRFWEVPTKLADFNTETGANFYQGQFDGKVLKKFMLHNAGILIEASVNTYETEKISDDFIAWALERFDAHYVDSVPVSKVFTSTMEVRVSDAVAARFNGFGELSSRLTEMVRGYGINSPDYTITNFAMTVDEQKVTGLKAGRFLFERRASRPFEDNVFYTEAPVTSEQHWELLNILERALSQ